MYFGSNLLANILLIYFLSGSGCLKFVTDAMRLARILFLTVFTEIL